MTEERSCETCKFSSYNNGIGKACGSLGIFSCIRHDKWQPITKPKIQHTKEEWASIVDDLGWNPDVMVELEQKGYIRKSELVELVEEAEESFDEWDSSTSKNSFPLWQMEGIVKVQFKALQALKKDHPEFGGKK